jgi:hypothetical protein
MELGLTKGIIGSAVEQLHTIFESSGLKVDPAERAGEQFGPTTLDALHAFQQKFGLAIKDVIDEPCLAVLINIRERITINVGDTPPQPPPKNGTHGTVQGTLVNQDGAPIPSMRVILFAKYIRSQSHLGEATTDSKGKYTVRYTRPAALNLFVQASDSTEKVVATSPTVFAAPATVTINFTSAADGVLRPPSRYTLLNAAVAAQLGDIGLSSLVENNTTHELQFLASAVGSPFDDVAYLYIGDILGTQLKIERATFFGIFEEGIPASLDAALASLPDAGIDSTFASQVLSAVLAQSDVSLSMILSDAVTANILPASYSATAASEVSLLSSLRTTTVAATPYIRGKTSLNDLLAAGSISSGLQTAFTQAYADSGGMLGPTWKTLRANKNLPAAELTSLNTTLSLGELLAGNLPLVKDSLSRITAGSLTGVQNLALLDVSDWEARITSVDPDASSIPPVLPNETPAQRITRFATALAQRFASRYPTTAFAGALSKATTSSFAKNKQEIVSFLTSNPKFTIKRTNLDQFISTNKLTVSAAALTDLKTAQRLHRISPHFTTVDAMKTAGYLSAQSVYFQGRDNFISAMTKPLGSASLAKMAYARSHMVYATSLMALGRYSGAFNGIILPVQTSTAPPPDSLTNLPDLQALFGSLDYFQCDDCQSVYSPAAYLVDLLQYLSWFTASGGGVTNARDAFLLRRPDVQYIALNCDNTNTTMPYIDLVNELLESVIAPPSPAVTVITTLGTSAERRALPQQISSAAYDLTRATVFPLNLPFDLDFAQTTACIAGLGTTRAVVMQLFSGSTTTPAIAASSLGINPDMQAVIDGTDGNTDWARWGLAQHPAFVIDPSTRQPYSPNPADWTAALAKVPFLLYRSGLTLQQLYQLLEVLWVTQSSVTLQAGLTTMAGLQVLSSSTDDMVFTGLTADVLDRANRFLRLWAASGLQMWELDWALEEAPGGALNDAFLVFLAGAIAVRNQLSLPFQEVLSFWLPLETRDVTNHLGDEDAVQPSTYTEVFRNPAVLASAANIFVPVGSSIVTAASDSTPITITTAAAHGYQTNQSVTITGAAGNTAANGTFQITVVTPTQFTLNGSAGNGVWTSGGTVTGILSGQPILGSGTATPTAEQNAVAAALGLSGDEIDAILTWTGAANTLSLPTLSVLLQYQRLASALSLQVADLILWIQLTARKPFTQNPSDTIEFCRRLAVLQSTGLADYDVDYLLRNQSITQTSLAFTQAQSTATLQAICAAIAKLPTPQTIAIAGISGSGTSPIVITTAAASGLLNGTQVVISGAGGNTAANGTFTISITSPTTFTLNGTTGNGNWTSGGAITVNAYNAATIQTIFVGALAAATSTTANVVTPLLLRQNVLPLAPAAIAQLAAQAVSVDPTQFPALVNAFNAVAKGAALFTALRPTETEFAFLIANASSFNWLDPSALPLTPVATSPYAQFEALVRALTLDKRQTALLPKLFDVLTQWLPPNTPPPDINTTINGPTFNVTAASNASPIQVTTSVANGLETGMQVTITGVAGNTAANGTFLITVTGPTTFTLTGTIGNGAWTSGGTVSTPGLAFALNASAADVLAIATQLGANAPSLVAASQPGTLADMAMLTAIAAALKVTTQYGISGATLVQLAAAPATPATSSAAMGALQSQYAQSAWFGAIQPIEDTLRQNRRDALVSYILGPGPASPGPLMLNVNDIYNYYLIDPEMCPCALMTRLLQASLAIQQFVQQCFLNLFFFTTTVTITMTDSRWDEWSWRQQYRLWEANRMVFLYPENYVLPELRKDASYFFTDLESDLQQSTCNEDLAETALENYLRKLLGVARLVIVAHYNEARADGTFVLHVFAHTRGTPAQWFYRTRSGNSPNSGSWSPWTQLNLDIASQHLLPVIWDQRLYLVWPVFKQISEKQSDQAVPSGSGGGTQPAPQKYWSVEYCTSQLSAGQWQPKQTIAEKAYFSTPDSPLAFTLRAWQEANFSLQIQVYFVGLEEAIQQATTTALVTEDVENAVGAMLQVLTEFGFPNASSSVEINQNFSASWLGSSASVRLTWNNGSPSIATISTSGVSRLVMQATLFMPESPLQIQEVAQILPGGQYMDLAQDPTWALIGTANLSGSLATPAKYGFSGQDLVWGNYTLPNPGTQVLNVLATSTYKGQPSTVELLGTITNPRIVVPPQEPIFDSADPFFVADLTRTYLVQPTYWTVSSSPTEIPILGYTRQWGTRFEFETFYHPYARTMLRELEIGGVDQLMERNFQVNPQTVRGWTPTFNFATIYQPQPSVAKPYPGATGAPDAGESALDFAVGDSGAYSEYNWEVFYHVPMFTASLLLQNQQFQDALNWLKYIFNPTDTSSNPSPQRFWQTAPFFAMNASDWAAQQVQNLLTTLAADTQQGIGDPATVNAITNWMNDPFDPHAIAGTRISAYAKATVMQFLNVLLAWGDWYYAQYTAEFVSQAEQLYVLAQMILGPQPQQLRLPSANVSGAATWTYASLKDVDAFSNVLVSVENIVVAPEPPQSIVQGSTQLTTLPQFPSAGNTLLFCIPPNSQLLAYWNQVAQRLYNIRHCLNLQGQPQPLPLYAPPINPLALIEAAAAGASFSSATPSAPIYRFSNYLQKALDLTNDVRAYGNLILSALEKQDAENLAVLRANQEVDIQTRTLDVKNLQVTEAQDQVAVLQNQQAVVQVRFNFYSAQIAAGLNAWETTSLALHAQALAINGNALVLDLTAGELHLIPSFSFGVDGFGGTPSATASFGGDNVAGAVSAMASVIRGMAGLLTEAAGTASTMGSFQRRTDEWTLQMNLANAELTQIGSQITAANDRLAIAQKELTIQNEQIANAQAVATFLTNKYTNAQLYNWMISQLTTVYTQAYQLAFSLAIQTQNAYQYELGSQDTFIGYGYWDSQHKGLTAGESLLFDLRRMESQYLAENSRELEITRHFSLALTNPLQLVTLRETGQCAISLDEILFEYDKPGQYFRRLRSVALTIPCVTGPYTSVNATLTLNSALVRTGAAGTSSVAYSPQTAGAAPNDPNTVIVSPVAAAGAQTIVTSTAQNDAGLFDVNLRDERWLPFEGQGAISTWTLTLDPRDNNIDFTTITDVVLHVRYTARGAGNQTAANAVRAALKPKTTQRSIMVSVRNTFPNPYYTFFNPLSGSSAQTLALPLTTNVFPYTNLGLGAAAAAISNISFYVVLSVSASGNTTPVSITPAPSSPFGSLAPWNAPTTAGDSAEALTASAAYTPSIASPQTIVLTIPSATLPSGISTTLNGQQILDPAKVQDILLVINYAID